MVLCLADWFCPVDNAGVVPGLFLPSRRTLALALCTSPSPVMAPAPAVIYWLCWHGKRQRDVGRGVREVERGRSERNMWAASWAGIVLVTQRGGFS